MIEGERAAGTDLEKVVVVTGAGTSADDSRPVALEEALDRSTSVTQFLEALTGQVIVADVLRQSRVPDRSDNGLGVTAAEIVTRRIAVLRGSSTSRPYVYAESLFVGNRLPDQVFAQLEQGTDPIGRILVTHDVGFDRAPMPDAEVVGPELGDDFADQVVLHRGYRLLINGQPTFAIREWFLRSVLDALAHPG